MIMPYMGQPVKSGGYITVRASKLGKEIGIALLYSCATDNKVYLCTRQIS